MIPRRPLGIGLRENTARLVGATGTMTPKEIIAVNNLEGNLQDIGILSKGTVAYLGVGGTEDAISYNFFNPSQYKTTWFGNGTFDENGFTGNGVDAYGSTGYTTPIEHLNSSSVFVYNRTQTPNSVRQCGSFTAFSTPINCGDYIQINDGGAAILAISSSVPTGIVNADGRGIFGISRIDSANIIRVVAGTVVSLANASQDITSIPMFYGSLNLDGSPFGYTDSNVASIFRFTGLTLSEVSDFIAVNDQFQTELGRNV